QNGDSHAVPKKQNGRSPCDVIVGASDRAADVCCIRRLGLGSNVRGTWCRGVGTARDGDSGEKGDEYQAFKRHFSSGSWLRPEGRARRSSGYRPRLRITFRMGEMRCRLTLLGSVSLTRASGAPNRRAIQQRRVALLAVLASNPRGFLSRDRLLGLLWPD